MQPSAIPAGLPRPDSVSLRHSVLVTDFIGDTIAASGGAITFGEYMQHALYAPGLGYYAAGAAKLGAAGDFVTAPEISPLFGRVVAEQCAVSLAGLTNGDMLELGAGSGALAAQILSRLAELRELPRRYLILEVSPELAQRQRQTLAQAAPAIVDRVQWIDELPRHFNGVIIANEVADALPVERFRVHREGIQQAYVIIGDAGLTTVWREASAPVSEQVVALGLDLPEGYVSELSPALKPWLAEIIDGVDHGLMLLFDYGLSRREYYAADRSGGWLRCHFRHRAHADPMIFPGIQDLTAWVDFTAVAEAAVDSGADVAGFVTQAMFLLHGGLQNALPPMDTMSATAQVDLARQIKLLTLPGEMGENFKCMGLCKGQVIVPPALLHGDRSAAL